MSEGITVPLGDELPLSFTLPAGASGFFPQAFVTDDADVAVAGSPFDLTEVGATARYTRFPAASFTPAAVGSFTARFVVFSDAAHLIEALQFTRDQDSYEVLSVANAMWDGILTGATHNIPTSAGRRLRELSDFGIRDEGQAQAGCATTITLAATAPTLDDVLVGGYVVITGGLGVGQVRVVVAYDGTTKIATVDRAWSINPDATSDYLVGLAADSIPVSDLFDIIRDAILSDATPFPGANIDATISSRSTFNEVTDPVELLDAGGAAGTSAAELVADIGADLSATHGAGSWLTGGAAPTVAAIVAGVWSEALPGAFGAGSAGFNLDVPVSSRPTLAAIVAGVWGESLGLGLFGAGEAGTMVFELYALRGMQLGAPADWAPTTILVPAAGIDATITAVGAAQRVERQP